MNKKVVPLLQGPGLCFGVIAGLGVYQGTGLVQSVTPGDGWILIGFGVLVFLATCLSASLPDIKTERQLRNERLATQKSQRPGWSLEENCPRVLAHLELEARKQQDAEFAEVAEQFHLSSTNLEVRDEELVS